MKTIEEIFGENAHNFEQDDSYAQAEFNIFDVASGPLIETAIQNIDDTPGLESGYAERHPVLLAGLVQAMLFDHNTRHLINTLQVSCAAQIEAKQKHHEALLNELQEIREAIKSQGAAK